MSNYYSQGQDRLINPCSKTDYIHPSHCELIYSSTGIEEINEGRRCEKDDEIDKSTLTRSQSTISQIQNPSSMLSMDPPNIPIVREQNVAYQASATSKTQRGSKNEKAYNDREDNSIAEPCTAETRLGQFKKHSFERSAVAEKLKRFTDSR